MRRRLLSLFCILHTALLIIAVALLPAFVFAPEGFVTIMLLRCLILLLPLTLNHLAIRRCPHMWQYLLIMLSAVILCILFSRNLAESIYFTAAILIVSIISIVGRVNQNSTVLDHPGFGYLPPFVLLYFIAIYFKDPGLQAVYYYITFSYLLLCIVYTNSNGLAHFLSDHAQTANLPAKQIIKSNRMIMTLLLVVVMVTMVLLPISGFDRLIASAGNGLLHLIRLFFSLFSASDYVEEIPETQAMETDAQGTSGLPPAKDAPLWLQTLLDAAAFIFTAAVLIGLFVLLCYSIYHVVKRFYRSTSENNDVSEFVFSASGQADTKAPRSKHPRKLRWDFSNEAQIRKLYIKLIRRNQKEAPFPAATPQEIEDYAKLIQTPDLQVLHDYYEQARYSETTITSEELSHAQELAKRL